MIGDDGAVGRRQKAVDDRARGIRAGEHARLADEIGDADAHSPAGYHGEDGAKRRRVYEHHGVCTARGRRCIAYLISEAQQAAEAGWKAGDRHIVAGDGGGTQLRRLEQRDGECFAVGIDVVRKHRHIQRGGIRELDLVVGRLRRVVDAGDVDGDRGAGDTSVSVVHRHTERIGPGEVSRRAVGKRTRSRQGQRAMRGIAGARESQRIAVGVGGRHGGREIQVLGSSECRDEECRERYSMEHLRRCCCHPLLRHHRSPKGWRRSPRRSIPVSSSGTPSQLLAARNFSRLVYSVSRHS